MQLANIQEVNYYPFDRNDFIFKKEYVDENKKLKIIFENNSSGGIVKFSVEKSFSQVFDPLEIVVTLKSSRIASVFYEFLMLHHITATVSETQVLISGIDRMVLFAELMQKNNSFDTLSSKKLQLFLARHNKYFPKL